MAILFEALFLLWFAALAWAVWNFFTSLHEARERGHEARAARQSAPKTGRRWFAGLFHPRRHAKAP